MSAPREEPLVTGDGRADELEAAWFERLLDVPDADDVPQTYEPLAAVLLALRAPAKEDFGGEAAAIAMFRSCQVGGTSSPAGSDRARPAKALTVAMAVALATVTGAMAAAGRLPADIQDMTSELLDKVGIHIRGADSTSDQAPRPSDGRPAAGPHPVTAASGSSGSRRGLPTRSGTAMTEPVRTSATDPTASTASPDAPGTIIAVGPVGVADSTAPGAPQQPPDAPRAQTAAPISAPTPSTSPPTSPPTGETAGPPIAPSADDHASPPAGPPITPPADDHASPPAGPPITPPADDHASRLVAPSAAALGRSEAAGSYSAAGPERAEPPADPPRVDLPHP